MYPKILEKMTLADICPKRCCKDCFVYLMEGRFLQLPIPNEGIMYYCKVSNKFVTKDTPACGHII